MGGEPSREISVHLWVLEEIDRELCAFNSAAGLVCRPFDSRAHQGLQKMHSLITGTAGSVGQILAKKLLDDEVSKHTLTLTDMIEPPIPSGAKLPHNAKCITADLNTQFNLAVDKNLHVVYVFHKIMSSSAEADFNLGMKANFDATRTLLEALCTTCPGVHVIYASSQAVFGASARLLVTEA